MPPSIYDYIKGEENRFETEEVQVGHNWRWSFRNHVQLIFHLKNGVFYTGENNWLRAFKNIMEPILNLAYWSEDIELKDVVFYIEQTNGRILSFLVKKFHDEVYVKENNLDQLFDEITESDLDYGGALVQKTNAGKPEVFDLPTIAFCDQTDILGGPIAFKFTFSPSKLRSMAKLGWGNEKNGATVSIEELITLADTSKDVAGMSGRNKNQSTGKAIDVYIVRGDLPDAYLNDTDDMEYYCRQVQIIAMYYDQDRKRQGVVLYRKEEDDGTIKFMTSKKVTGRALGRGEGEALLHPQIWTNFLEIHKTQMLQSGAKVPLVTDDENFASKNNVQNMENLEITKIEKGATVVPIPTIATANIQLYSNAVNEWYSHAQLAGSAFDPILGKEPPSGTTFKGQERNVAQGSGLHERRRGQRAKFIEEIYRDWIIPDITKQILKGKEFLSTLTGDEMSWVSDQLAENYASRQRDMDALDLKIPRPKDELKKEFLTKFSKLGNKHLITILKGEFKDVGIKMGINVANKQKDLAGMTDKIFSIIQFIAANPQGFQYVLQIPGMGNALNDILEFSGISQVDFANFVAASQTPPPQSQQAPQPQPAPQTAPQPNQPSPVLQ